tara:strand:+ start:55049 stop:55276 length:228 start_codon:yes stop_codon:yes gene_type:complete
MKSSLSILFILVFLVGKEKKNSDTDLKIISKKTVIEKRIWFNKNGIIFPNYTIEFEIDSFETTKKPINKPHQSLF